jgi:phosphatidylglycerophosphate synthase
MVSRAGCSVEAESRAFTNTVLTALRADRWSPKGWARFVGRVTVRSLEQIGAHPRAAIEVTLLHGLFIAVARGRGRRWIATSWLMASIHLGLLGRRRSIGWATAISLARANLAATGAPLGRWVGVVAVASDRLDGAVARRQGPTMFGSYADALADAAFWTWLGIRGEPSRLVRVAALAAWAAPAVSITAATFATGEVVEAPKPARLRPAAAMQAVLALRILRGGRSRRGFSSPLETSRNSRLVHRVPLLPVRAERR